MTILSNSRPALISRITAGIFAFSLIALTTEPSRAQSTEATSSSDEFLRIGIAAYKKRDYVAARNALLSAFQRDSVTAVAALLADVEMKLKRYRDAAEHWNVYLNGLAPDQSEQRTEALAQLENCRKHVGTVKVTVEPKDALLVVDGITVDLRPTDGDLWLEPGTHSLEVKVEDRASQPKTVAIAPGDKLMVTLSAPSPAPVGPVAPSAPQASTLAVAPPTESKPLETKTLVLIGGGVLTLAGVTVGTIYAIKFSAASSDRDAAVAEAESETTDKSLIEAHAFCGDANPNPPAACKDIRSALVRMDRTQVIAEGAFITAGVIGLATIGTYLLWPTSKGSSPTKTGIAVAPWMSPSSQGVTASVAF